MKKIHNLFILLLCLSLNLFSQKTETNDLKISDLDSPPIIKYCDSDGTKADQIKCFNSKFTEKINKKFRMSVINKERRNNLEAGSYSFQTVFKINKEADITDVNVDFENENIANEVKRILRKIKIIKPGMVNGKPVSVKYSFPINFTTE